MLSPTNSFLITGNKKDYPVAVFDTNIIISIEKNNGDLFNFCLISFNIEKFTQAFKELNKLNRLEKRN
jgi:hypothetical protein